MVLPSWATAGRPSSPVAGQMGYNTTLGYIEWYSTVYEEWQGIFQGPNYTINYLMIAGGGAGGVSQTSSSGGGGGGAGGLLSGVQAVNSKESYTIVIGAGGASVC